ncbi:right-handed parallel beta-helix repeat-containing protein [Aureliella helgolandensis]|uniref:Right handed beta helix domain-containing protein n=1 Tax=Aureliella helgolandensis TaxID=2527968 RepID=A0A518G9H2_9BACT|nr:right-handed parallel beta-helix repeat-containing protein [Aureliella helgolandensis]QDV25223.1 hypothetical protein Q31a_35460 [Aureliella helgolandensis]
MKTLPLLFTLAVLSAFVGRAYSQQAAAATGAGENTLVATDQLRLGKLLEKSKGKLVIPAGKYEFGGTLDIDLTKFDGLSLKADGPVTITMKAAGPAIRITGSLVGRADPDQIKEHTWLERMPLIDGIGIIGDHPEADGIELVQTMQSIISRVHIRKTRHGIILSKRNRNVVISNVHLYHNSGIGLYLNEVDLHQINVGNSHISYNTQGGIVVRGGNVRNLHITGCDIEANMPSDPTPTESGNLFIDCRESGSVAEVAITGNTIQHFAHYHPQKQAPGGANIRIAGRGDFQPNMITITGNVMSDTHTHVHLQQASDVTVIGNTYFTTEPTDVLVENCQRIIIANSVMNPREAKGTGQVVLKNSSNCSVMGLICHNLLAGRAAISLENCRDTRISECVISGSRNGIQLDGCQNCSVTDCTVSDLPPEGLGVTGELEENSIRDITASHLQVDPIVDSLEGEMRKQWRWLRENKDGWKLTDSALQVLIEPGNMWGKDNDAKNVLIHPIPPAWQHSVDISVQLEQHPQKRWEQTNLVWYYSDSLMVKIGLELEHGETNIVMGREEGDRTRTIAIVPYPANTVQLRLEVEGLELRGFYREPGEQDWNAVGTATLPADSATPAPQVSLQCYMGEAGSDRWASFSQFKMCPIAR